MTVEIEFYDCGYELHIGPAARRALSGYFLDFILDEMSKAGISACTYDGYLAENSEELANKTIEQSLFTFDYGDYETDPQSAVGQLFEGIIPDVKKEYLQGDPFEHLDGEEDETVEMNAEDN